MTLWGLWSLESASPYSLSLEDAYLYLSRGPDIAFVTAYWCSLKMRSSGPARLWNMCFIIVLGVPPLVVNGAKLFRGTPSRLSSAVRHSMPVGPIDDRRQVT